MAVSKIDDRFIERIIFGKLKNNNRFTQDSPVYPDVRLDYFEHFKQLATYRCDVILSPAPEYYRIRIDKIIIQDT
ncbi:MAG: hypothetical protein IPG38_10040 [Chitinophagaceae bacterium]|nr:hypothetical protein [Chitinophagaceae bacterium]